MASGRRTLVVAFGYEIGSWGWSATADLHNYDLKRRLGEWESSFVGAGGRVQQIIPIDSHDDAVALRDRLNDAPTTTVRQAVEARGMPRQKIAVLQHVLDTAFALCEQTGEPSAEVSRLVWSIIDAAPGQIAELQRDMIAQAARKQTDEQKREWADFSDFPFGAVIFDIDQTLVDSAELGTPDSRRTWAQRALDDGRVHPLKVKGGVPAHVLPTMLAERGVKVGIASRSPEIYVSQVCRLFGIRADVVRAGTGDKARSIAACAKALGVEPESVVVIGDDVADILAARAIGARALGALWTPERWPDRLQPDIACREPELLLRVADWRRLAFVGEQPPDVEPIVHAGSWISYGSDRTFALGRYFGRTNPRHQDRLTQALLAWKGRTDPHPAIARALRIFGERVEAAAGIDLVTSVPPTSGGIDRFSGYRSVAAGALGCTEASILTMRRGVDRYKYMSHERRRDASDGRFAADSTARGARILVMDDVTTSGATFAACDAALRSAGAAEVNCLAFAATQD